MNITELLTFTKEQGASDLHLSAGVPPIIRLHGSLRRLKMDSLSAEELRRMLYTILSEDQRKRFEKELELDFSYSVNGGPRFRVNIFRQGRGEGAVMDAHKLSNLPLIPLPIPVQQFREDSAFRVRRFRDKLLPRDIP